MVNECFVRNYSLTYFYLLVPLNQSPSSGNTFLCCHLLFLSIAPTKSLRVHIVFHIVLGVIVLVLICIISVIMIVWITWYYCSKGNFCV